MLQLMKRLKLLKKKLKNLNKEHFRKILIEVEKDRVALDNIQKLLHNNPTDMSLQAQEKLQSQKFRRISYLVEIFLQQRSKVAWIRLGDDNTRYFYSMIKHKRLQHAITYIKDKVRVVQTKRVAITQVLVEYYEEMLGTRERNRVKSCGSILQNGYYLTIDQQLELVQPYCAEDVQKVLFKMNVNKSRGPYGFGIGFFRAA
ncbi:hypothetical protein P3L10_015071 [Capsicum annuum]|uniref:uncharacterized protein LOC107871609 n=1 Tax=Capsicum annuum TaxID=4072 RepID=UPI0007BF77D4|nr:uncharacterized protein LOC107871609 [Capsicum annuum]